MREDHHDLQTPKKEHPPVSSNRKAKPISSQSKKLNHPHQKSSRRSLISVFTPINEDEVVLNLSEKDSIEKMSSISESVDADHHMAEISKRIFKSDQTLVSDEAIGIQHLEESIGISPISESFVFDEDQSSESMESYIMSLNQFLSPSSVTPGLLEGTPLSSPITAECGATTEETNSLVNHLRKSMVQILHSAEIDPHYKNLLDALIKTVIEEFHNLHEEKDTVVDLYPRKVKVVLLSFVLCILAVSAGFFVFSDVQSSYDGPTPT